MPAAEAPKKPFEVDSYLGKLAAFANAFPHLTARVYYRGAATLRDEATRNTRQRFQYLSLAKKLDQIAADADDKQQEELVRAREAEEQAVEQAVEPVDPVEEVFGSSREAMGTVRQIQHERGVIAQPVRIIPSSVSEAETVVGTQVLLQYGGSSGSGQFTGRGSSVSGPLVAQQEAPIIRWEGKKTEAQTVTCMIYQVQGGAGATYPAANDAAGNFYSYRPAFHLFWGGDYGFNFEAYGDVCRGTQFTLSANRLYVNALMAPPLSTQIPGSMVVGGSFGFFSAARFSPVYRTIYVDQMTVGSSRTIVIPILATVLEAVYSDAGTSDLTIQFQTNSGAPIFNVNSALAQVRGNAVAIPNSAYQIQFTANTLAANLEVVFSLAL